MITVDLTVDFGFSEGSDFGQDRFGSVVKQFGFWTEKNSSAVKQFRFWTFLLCMKSKLA